MSFRTTFDPFLHHIDKVPSLRKRPTAATGAHSCQTRSSRNYFVGVCFVCMFYCVIRLLLVNIIYFIVSSFEEISCKLKFNGAQTVITIGIGIHRWLLASCGIVSNIAQFIVYFERICMVVFEASDFCHEIPSLFTSDIPASAYPGLAYRLFWQARPSIRPQCWSRQCIVHKSVWKTEYEI